MGEINKWDPTERFEEEKNSWLRSYGWPAWVEPQVVANSKKEEGGNREGGCVGE